jgi:hypothetical protein
VVPFGLFIFLGQAVGNEARPNIIAMLRDEIEAINTRRLALGRDQLPGRAGC